MLSLILRELLLPPGCLLILLMLALLARQRYPRGSTVAIVVATSLLYLLSIAPVAGGLMRLSEKEPPVRPADIAAFRPQAIVILGGGAEVEAPEYGSQTVVNEFTLKRVAYAAYLGKQTGLPLLVTGGFGRIPSESEAWAMKSALEAFGLKTQWLETKGQTTRQNAEFSQALLGQAKVERVLLVTGASHARRARVAFEKVGLEVLAAPTGFHRTGPRDQGLMTVVPSSRHFNASCNALRALLAEAWYVITGG